MIESNLCHCKKCSLLKTRIEDGKYPNSKNKRYIDENGKLWSGKTCSQCVVNKARENMKNLRFQRHLESIDADKE